MNGLCGFLTDVKIEVVNVSFKAKQRDIKFLTPIIWE